MKTITLITNTMFKEVIYDEDFGGFFCKTKSGADLSAQFGDMSIDTDLSLIMVLPSDPCCSDPETIEEETGLTIEEQDRALRELISYADSLGIDYFSGTTAREIVAAREALHG